MRPEGGTICCLQLDIGQPPVAEFVDRARLLREPARESDGRRVGGGRRGRRGSRALARRHRNQQMSTGRREGTYYCTAAVLVRVGTDVPTYQATRPLPPLDDGLWHRPPARRDGSPTSPHLSTLLSTPIPFNPLLAGCLGRSPP